MSDRKIIVLYTGGTIGMKRDDNGQFAPVKGYLSKYVKENCQLYDKEYARVHGLNDEWYPLPIAENDMRVRYRIVEFANLIDSSNVTFDNWTTLAGKIQDNYSDFNGFVILHGTDTMVYTASMLSFMFENLTKPVVITGSQIPLSVSQSDGVDNMLGAILLAARPDIQQEVSLYFDHVLYRGNRCVKVSNDDFAAFTSPNCEPLATVGVNTRVIRNNDPTSNRISNEASGLQILTTLESKICVIRIFPGISRQLMRAFLDTSPKGVVLQTYGAGNAPTDSGLLQELTAAIDQDVIIVNCSQCSKGNVTPIYETGQALQGAGVISGGDMTTEAAFCKLSHVLGLDQSVDEAKEMMQRNLRNEMSN